MGRRIILTGGGTAGHVTPHLALIESLEQQAWLIDYIGSHAGIERTMIEREGIPYHAISTGKFRRYWTWQHLLEPFRVLKGVWDAWRHLRRLKPQLVFSKGGFVAFPVVLSAWALRIPVVAHESDLTPGLANRLSFPFLNRLCVAFPATKQTLKHHRKITVTGTPIRAALFQGDAAQAFVHCGFSGKKPVLLVVGGSLGANLMNQVLRACLPRLCTQYHVLHLCGQGKLDEALVGAPDYFQCEYAHDEMADFMAASTVVVSRAGANSLYELMALEKPHVLIPLSARASRGDQIENARYFAQQGISVVLDEQHLEPATLLMAIDKVYAAREDIQARIRLLNLDAATDRVLQVLTEVAEAKA